MLWASPRSSHRYPVADLAYTTGLGRQERVREVRLVRRAGEDGDEMIDYDNGE